MEIGELCKTKAITIANNASIQQAAKLMRENDIGSVVVTQAQANKNVPIGILTDRDITIKAVAEQNDLQNMKVEQIMSKKLLLIEDDDDIETAIEKMKEREVRRAPVLNEDEELCGIVSLDDLLIQMAKNVTRLASLVENQLGR